MVQDSESVEHAPLPRRFLRESPDWQRKAYDDTRAAPAAVLASLHSYDPQLFLRYNRMFVRWELWWFRRRECVVPTLVGLSPEEIVKRAGHVFDIVRDNQYVEPDERLLPAVKAADWWARFRDGADAAKAIEAAELEAERRARMTDQEAFIQIADDNKRQIREFFGSSSPMFFFYKRGEAA